jgi:hypothetical protein
LSRGTGVARQRWGRAGLIAAAGALIGGIAVAGTGDGNPAQDVRLRSGAAWLASAKVGQVTLLDGSSAEVSAQVQVAPAGNQLDVVQQGSTAYAIDQSAGTIRRIDGATFDLTPPESPIPDAHAGLTALPGPDALYTLDSRRGILANTDPRNLTRRGELLSLASELSAGTAVVDESGTLWAIDTSTGDLARVAGGKRSTRPQVTTPGPTILTMAGGHPVVVDVNARKAISIDRTNGKPGGTLDLDLRKDDTVEISGSPRDERLYVVAGRGNLSICDLSRGQCGNAIPLTAGNKFGAAVEAGNRLFVPDHTTGQVWVVDLANSQVIAKPTVLAPAGPFQLLTRDGVVFYNDPNSAQAGVIHLDGTVSKTAKYDADDPTKGIHVPTDSPTRPPTNPQQPTTNPQPPDKRINQPNDPQQPTTNPQPTNPRQPDPNNPQQPDPALEISVSNASPTVDQPITLQVRDTKGPIPGSAVAEWTFGDGQTGGGITTSHKWAAAKPTPYNITVKVNYPGGKSALASVGITVTEKPTFKLTVTGPNGTPLTGGKVTGGGINCPGACEASLAPDTVVTLSAQPDQVGTNGTWGGACSGTNATCDVTMNAKKDVTHAFEATRPIEVSPAPTGGTVSGVDNGATIINCPGTCAANVVVGHTVTLTANPSATTDFDAWTGRCAGQGQTCRVTVDVSSPKVSVAATFKPKKVSLTISFRQESDPGQVTGPGGVNCTVPNTCTYQFDINQPIELIAGTDRPMREVAWSDKDCDERNGWWTCTITMDKARSINVLILYEL